MGKYQEKNWEGIMENSNYLSKYFVYEKKIYGQKNWSTCKVVLHTNCPFL